MSTPGDVRELAQLAARPHDPQARTQLVLTVHQVVRRYCRALLGRSGRDFARADELADELAEGIATRVLRERGHDVTGPEPVEAILYAAMASAVAGALAGTTLPAPQPAVGPVSPEHVREHLLRLPPRAREVLVLRAFVGLTTEQVSRALGLGEDVVLREQRQALAGLGTSVTAAGG